MTKTNNIVKELTQCGKKMIIIIPFIHLWYHFRFMVLCKKQNIFQTIEKCYLFCQYSQNNTNGLKNIKYALYNYKYLKYNKNQRSMLWFYHRFNLFQKLKTFIMNSWLFLQMIHNDKFDINLLFIFVSF